jgi:hypothetical protein
MTPAHGTSDPIAAMAAYRNPTTSKQSKGASRGLISPLSAIPEKHSDSFYRGTRR